MAANTNPHPEDVRIAVRYANYANSETEAQVIRDTDNAVFDRVRFWEHALVEQVQTARTDALVDTTAAQETIDALQGEVRWALDRPVSELDLPAMAARYKLLRATAEKVIAALEKADRQEEAYAVKLQDPQADLAALWAKWPMIRPII